MVQVTLILTGENEKQNLRQGAAQLLEQQSCLLNVLLVPAPAAGVWTSAAEEMLHWHSPVLSFWLSAYQRSSVLQLMAASFCKIVRFSFSSPSAVHHQLDSWSSRLSQTPPPAVWGHYQRIHPWVCSSLSAGLAAGQGEEVCEKTHSAAHSEWTRRYQGPTGSGVGKRCREKRRKENVRVWFFRGAKKHLSVSGTRWAHSPNCCFQQSDCHSVL